MRKTKKQLRAELAAAEARIRELEQPMSDRELVTTSCSSGGDIWCILTALRGPDGGGKFQPALKVTLTEPVRRWARGRSVTVYFQYYISLNAHRLLGFTGATARRADHYLNHIYFAVRALKNLGLIPEDEMWYADAIINATSDDFEPKVLVEAIEAHQAENESANRPPAA